MVVKKTRPSCSLTADRENIVESSKRLFSRPIKKKEPVTPSMIFRICSSFAQMDSNLKDLRSALLFVLGFYGLFRISEFINFAELGYYSSR